ncbi:MAG TPA: glycosyltransferase [Rhizomicrobium sp.]|jgi:spore maturation protein CgeB|nr:glycosyltransferase [Rhizomicrobium sp.]
MKLVVFGLTISSSWGNGHATLWRGLCRALASQGHRVTFFEKDVSYYAAARDYCEIPGGKLVLYREWQDAFGTAQRELESAEAAIITSYCPDALAWKSLVLDSAALHVFYDLDTPVTLGRLMRGEDVPYIGAGGLADFDLVLSFTGGRALEILQEELGAPRVAPLYGHADPDVHRRVPLNATYRSDLSYLGTYAADRQRALETLFVEPARARPHLRFAIGGAQYPQDFPWSGNIYFVRHLPPSEHPAFFSSSRLTLNITRRDMAAMGWCPSGRLFEAALCGTPVLSDAWEGLDAFFEPDQEIITAASGDETVAALDRSDAELRDIAKRARERVLSDHTSAHRARELIFLLQGHTPALPMRALAETGA